MTEGTEFVHLERIGSVATLTIDHPPVNVLSALVLDGLLARFAEVGRDPQVRAVVLASASDKAFAAGADIREMASMGPLEARVHGARGQAVTLAIERLPMPVVAAVNGSCLGGGCEIALACDFVLASEDARFGQPEVNLGVMPGWGGTQRLPRRIGAARAREWILTGRTTGASEAHDLGLVLRVVPRAELLNAARALAEELASKSASALAAAKWAVARGIDRGLEPGLAQELRLWEGLFATPDQKAGMAAFVAKRPWTPEARTPEPDPSIAPKRPSGPHPDPEREGKAKN
ncbi:MAG: enoyl-CoA hydratase/isomerase family protein [Thermoplasmata archaeon]|nr:enoyl-CoA hydratase/isomerase family protein [Thermoplasmata archaeon]MCI4359847.1 enoyl-CoA hydratase/isomerase family protein [Thermoplasmata archaeon]